MYIIFMLQSRPLQIYFRIHIGSRSQALVKFEIVKVGFKKEVNEYSATEREGSVLVLVLCPRFFSRHVLIRIRGHIISRDRVFWRVCFSGGVRV